MRKLKQKIGFLGCGNMGGAILGGLLRQKVCSSGNIIVFDVDRKKTNSLKKKWKVKTAGSPHQVFQLSDIIILAVKPQTFHSMKFNFLFKDKLIISILAGTSSEAIKKKLGTKNVIRVMPNLGAVVGEGITAIAKSSSVSRGAQSKVKQIFEACGETVLLPEKAFDVVTAISGSGPAYFFYLTELLIQNAVSRGIKKETAAKLSVKTLMGAASLLKHGNLSPEEFRRRVTSKGGTTEAALKAWKKSKFEQLFKLGITAAVKRGKSLSR